MNCQWLMTANYNQWPPRPIFWWPTWPIKRLKVGITVMIQDVHDLLEVIWALAKSYFYWCSECCKYQILLIFVLKKELLISFHANVRTFYTFCILLCLLDTIYFHANLRLTNVAEQYLFSGIFTAWIIQSRIINWLIYHKLYLHFVPWHWINMFQKFCVMLYQNCI